MVILALSDFRTLLTPESRGILYNSVGSRVTKAEESQTNENADWSHSAPVQDSQLHSAQTAEMAEVRHTTDSP